MAPSKHFAHVIGGAEQEGHGGHHGGRANVVHRCHVDAGHRNRPEFGLLDGVFLVAQSRLGKHFDAVFAIGRFVEQLTHVAHSLHGGVVVGMDVRRTELGCLRGKGKQRRHRSGCEGFEEMLDERSWRSPVVFKKFRKGQF